MMVDKKKPLGPLGKEVEALQKEFKEYKEEVNELFVNHKKAYANLKGVIEAHLWEPDAHHPAFLASRAKDRAKK
jgi:hypothetical protein